MRIQIVGGVDYRQRVQRSVQARFGNEALAANIRTAHRLPYLHGIDQRAVHVENSSVKIGNVEFFHMLFSYTLLKDHESPRFSNLTIPRFSASRASCLKRP